MNWVKIRDEFDSYFSKSECFMRSQKKKNREDWLLVMLPMDDD